MRFNLTREFYIPEGSIKVQDKASDAVAYLSTSPKSGKPLAMIFFGKQQKPVANFVYRSEAEREASVKRHFETRQAYAKRIGERRAAAQEFQHSAQVGDIYSTCWGYEQTNVEFYEIVEIRGKHAILREIGCTSSNNGSVDHVTPTPGKYLEPRYPGDEQGAPIRRLIQAGYIKIDDVRSASPWGKRDEQGNVTGGALSRTASGWGH